jgi:hypothetical protein
MNRCGSEHLLATRTEIDSRPHPSRAIMLEEVVSLEPFRVICGLRSATETNVGNHIVIRIRFCLFKGLSEGVALKHVRSVVEGGNVLLCSPVA